MKTTGVIIAGPAWGMALFEEDGQHALAFCHDATCQSAYLIVEVDSIDVPYVVDELESLMCDRYTDTPVIDRYKTGKRPGSIRGFAFEAGLIRKNQ